ncbi:transposase-like protein [Nocardia kruczakiae]|uniref:Transposase-like protein n=1 Tax=Nocardia kruczakiae TaxID=261477 RepID=A0ABU1XE56_9NOCA|nr:transposase-like protein [Nocardia kruczakiae]
MVGNHRDDYDSEGAAIRAVAARLGMTAETLRKWIRRGRGRGCLVAMPKPYPEEFRRDVVGVARKGEVSLTQIAKDFGILACPQ